VVQRVLVVEGNGLKGLTDVLRQGGVHGGGLLRGGMDRVCGPPGWSVAV
jgi:hypothetical protein